MLIFRLMFFLEKWKVWLWRENKNWKLIDLIAPPLRTTTTSSSLQLEIFFQFEILLIRWQINNSPPRSETAHHTPPHNVFMYQTNYFYSYWKWYQKHTNFSTNWYTVTKCIYFYCYCVWAQNFLYLYWLCVHMTEIRSLSLHFDLWRRMFGKTSYHTLSRPLCVCEEAMWENFMWNVMVHNILFYPYTHTRIRLVVSFMFLCVQFQFFLSLAPLL